MSEDVKHKGSLNQSKLETSLRNQEAIWRKLTKIKIVGGFTVSTHDDTTPIPANSLKLELDPTGNGAGPPGWSAVICRGDALIDGVPKKVATFRKD